MIYNLISVSFSVYSAAILIRILLSWLPMINQNNSVIRFIYDITEPYLAFFRRILPPSPSFPVDFSPILAIVALNLAEYLVFLIFSRIF
ncbi:MAG: YggT family protein [Firmicutes bacterium]|nr:YggT family protein [Bacillota bacterium]